MGIITPSVFVLPTLEYGGTESLVTSLATELARMGHAITVFAPKGSVVEGCQVVETIEAPKAWVADAEQRAWLTYKDRLGEFDVVHTHSNEKWEYLSKLENPSLRVMGTFHGIQTFTNPPPIHKPCGVALSRWHHKDMLDRYDMECEIVPNGVNLKEYKYDETQKKDYLLSLGLMATRKGHQYAIYYARKMGFKLVVAGSAFGQNPAYAEYLRGLCEGYPNITFLGGVTHLDKIRLLSEAKALLFPVLDVEADSIIIKEASASGTPVLTMNFGAIGEIVEEGVNGLLAANIDEFGEKIKRLDEIDPKECVRTAQERFSIEMCAKRYAELHKRVEEHPWG